MVGVCVRKSPSQWHPCNNTGRDRVLWIYPGLSKSSEHWEPLSVTDSSADAWGLSGTVPDDAERLWSSSTWNKIVLPINFLSYLVFPPAVSSPCWIWAPAHSAVSVWEGASLAAALPVCSPWHPALCLWLSVSPAVGMRSVNSGERSKAKPGLWAVRLLYIKWSVTTVHNDLFFLQDKCFCDKQWQSPGFSSIGGSSNWRMMSDKIIESWKGLCWKGP